MLIITTIFLVFIIYYPIYKVIDVTSREGFNS